jgi:outer membrane receptor protein involved in Fe transport
MFHSLYSKAIQINETIMRKILVFVIILSNFQLLHSQVTNVSVSGIIKDAADRQPLPYVNVTVYNQINNEFKSGTVTTEQGLFNIAGLSTGDYNFRISYVGYLDQTIKVHVGRLSSYLDLGTIFLSEESTQLEGVVVTGTRRDVASTMDKKTFQLDDNPTQQGGSVLQAMQNLPGITVDREGKVFLRGSDKVTVLIDGKQTAITGMGSQSGLDNIPASAIESIEIINNPSARHDASGMAGIINIVFKKEQEYGWNGRAGLTLGVGALGEKEKNLQGIRKQYQFTPKINPSLSANYKKNKLNLFIQSDLLYHKQMMKNEFTLRTYEGGEQVYQQFLENRTQPIYNIKGGIDWSPNSRNTFTFSTLFNYREYTDLGDIPYNNANGNRLRLWQYYENEVNQTLFATVTHKHLFLQPGHSLVSSFNYSFRRKDEVFYFTNNVVMPPTLGTDTTGLVADENIFDITVDYTKPLRSGRIELGTKQRARVFPNNIVFKPGVSSILDPTLAESAEYREWLSALYGTYVYEQKAFELEAGLRIEYAKIEYLVDPNHSVYESAGFEYVDPFPNVRATWIITDNSRMSFFYNRRVDRPQESDLRTFPTYASPEILSMGNPNLLPQFTQSFEVGYRQSWEKGYIYGAAYHRQSSNLLTKIITEVSDGLLAQVNQNADKGENTGFELVYSQQLGSKVKLSANANVYRNRIGAFEIFNAYPNNVYFQRGEQSALAGNAKLNIGIKLPRKVDMQLSAIYLAPDIVPQGRILARYSLDAALTKEIQKGKGEIFINATDLLNTLVVRYELEGTTFNLVSDDFYETQVIRFGYQYRF